MDEIKNTVKKIREIITNTIIVKTELYQVNTLLPMYMSHYMLSEIKKKSTSTQNKKYH